METKQEIFDRYKKEYWQATKQRKGEILSLVPEVTGMQRKAAIRKFRVIQMHHAAKDEMRGRSVYYTADVTAALKDIWNAGNEVCGELLHPIVSEYIAILKRDQMWQHAPEATAKLLQMSEGTMKQRVGHFFKIRRGHKGISATTPSALKRIVPIFTGPWEDKPPGYGQVDTVVHCGASLLGDMAYTLNYTDAATYLVLPRAQWNKGMEATKKSMQVIKERLPFPWLGAHPDTGSEFINRFVIEWCQKEMIELSRSRPGKKNDNMYVEERNGHVIRKTIGYQRIDCINAVDALNLLYDMLTPYLIHFVAVRRTLEKEKVQSKYRAPMRKDQRRPMRESLRIRR